MNKSHVLNHRGVASSSASPTSSSKSISSSAAVKVGSGVDATGHWGRNSNGSWLVAAGALTLMLSCPLFANVFNDAILKHEGELTATLLSYAEWFSNHRSPLALPLAMLESVWTVDNNAVKIFTCWMIYQLAMVLFMPGPTTYGHPTCAGNKLKYNVNGLNVYLCTHVLAVVLCYFGVISPTIIADNWRGLFVCANVFGLLLCIFAYIKAITFPSHAEDRKFSGSYLYDIFMGVEHNPRITDRFDFKLFFNTRPGMVAWTLIDLSFAASQYERVGYVSKEMIAVNLIHFVYVLDLFINESWYTRTIDIQHDHFGFYLAWGDMVWLPFCYTLQAQYLSVRPDISISMPNFILLMTMFATGYFIFRAVNAQKDYFRNADGKCMIWGKPATFIRASYQTIDGKVRESLLLTSGWWGLARHFNYTGDMLICIAVCAVCGTQNFLPFFYVIFMSMLLVHRVERDHERCLAKYGDAWRLYQQQVPFKLFPYLY